MSIFIVTSKADLASRSIASKLLEGYHFEETFEKFHGNKVYSLKSKEKELRLLAIDGELAYLQEISDISDAELIIFVSRHESRNGNPILSVHVPGNLSTAEFGGLSGKVSIAPANIMRAALVEMTRQRDFLSLKEFEIYYEGTHHGPSLDVPTLFLEIGSTAKEWTNPKAGEAVANAAIAATQCTSKVDAAVGIGGSHCNRRLTNLSLKFKVAFGHIIPSYALNWLTPEIVKQCVEKTLEQNPTIILDWKGIDGKDRNGLQEVLCKVPYSVKRVAEYHEKQ